jgi:hypothetical protein
MTETQRANISKARKAYFIRKRQSEAMKASWVRRRNGVAPTDEPTPKPEKKKVKVTVTETIVTFCPVCGCNIKNVGLAVNFGSHK